MTGFTHNLSNLPPGTTAKDIEDQQHFPPDHPCPECGGGPIKATDDSDTCWICDDCSYVWRTE